MTVEPFLLTQLAQSTMAPSQQARSLRSSSAQRRKLSIRCLIATMVMICAFSLYFAHQSVDEIAHEERIVATTRTKEQHAACMRMRTIKDIQACYHKMLVRPIVKDRGEHCQTVETYDDIQKCLVGRYYPEDHTLETKFTLHVVGERHSGTKFVQSELKRCFGDHMRFHKIHRDFLRSKHWFQPVWGGNHRTSIAIVVVRDPVEWMAAMHEKPYHAPDHVQSMRGDKVEPLPWQEFVNRQWAPDVLETKVDPSSRCTDDFKIGEVMPCFADEKSLANIPEPLRRGFAPVYEMHPTTKKPFKHLMELRAAKISNHVLQMPMLTSLGGFILVRYEDLLKEGTRPWLEHIAQTVGIDLPDTCQPSAPQPDRLHARFIPTAFREWVNEHIDEEMERIAGYR